MTSELGQTTGLGGKAWEAVCSATILTFGMCAKLVLRGLNTTVVHGRRTMIQFWPEMLVRYQPQLLL